MCVIITVWIAKACFKGIIVGNVYIYVHGYTNILIQCACIIIFIIVFVEELG